MSEEVIEAPAAEPVASPAPSAPAPEPAATAPVASPAPAPTEPAAEPAPPSKWSDTWREDMAGALPDGATEEQKTEHTKLLARLKRLNTPADVAKAIREQDKLISSGQLKKALPKDATPEQIAEFRKSNGIPETPDKYAIEPPAGVELNDLDKEMLAGVTAKMHAENATPAQVKAGVSAYFEVRQKIAEQMQEANATAKRDGIEELRAEWGQDYLTNTQGLGSMLNQLDSEARAAIENARTADGIQLLNIPSVVRALAGHARELGYVGATVVPAGGDLGKTMDDEIAAIEKSMFNDNGTKNPAYWSSQKQQDRYSQLLEAKARREK